MKPNSAIKLFAKVEGDSPRRPSAAVVLTRQNEYGTGSAPQRPSPFLAREASPAEKRSDPPYRPVFARPANKQPGPAPVSQPPAPSPARQPDLLTQIERAYERGKEEGRQIERDAMELKIAADLDAQRERAILERIEFQLNEYAKFSETIGNALEEIEQRLASTVARLLTPIFEEGLVDAAIAELTMTLQHLITDRSSGLIRIRGPERLLAKLRASLEPYAVAFEYNLEDRMDVLVEANDTVIETQFQRWSEILRQAENG